MTLRELFQPWSWWLEPSGGPYPTPWSLWTILSEAPLPAHAAGSLIAGTYLYVAGFRGFVLWWLIAGVHGAWQALQWENDKYGDPITQTLQVWREIGWREFIGMVSALPVLWL
jgi:hypothetical protein